jgi:PAP2 superfamily
MDAILRSSRSLSISQVVVGICGLYISFAVVLFPQTYLKVAQESLIGSLLFGLPICMGIGLVAAGLLNGPHSFVPFVYNRIMQQGATVVVTTIVFLLTVTAFSTVKYEYARIVPFFADHFLADLDATLHFGDPWIWTRRIVPDFLDEPLAFAYSGLWFLQVVASIVFAAFLFDRRKRETYFLTLIVSTTLLSTLLRVVGSSAGPIFYDRIHGGDRFSALMANLLASEGGSSVLGISDYLYYSYISESVVVGTGISAMPSFHVAFATLNSLFFMSVNRIVGRIMIGFASVIMFGSVYFGWHYALDGYVSILVVCLIWRWAEKVSNSANTQMLPLP